MSEQAELLKQILDELKQLRHVVEASAESEMPLMHRVERLLQKWDALGLPDQRG